MQELADLERLGQIVEKAGVEASLDVARHGVGAQGDDGEVRAGQDGGLQGPRLDPPVLSLLNAAAAALLGGFGQGAIFVFGHEPTHNLEFYSRCLCDITHRGAFPSTKKERTQRPALFWLQTERSVYISIPPMP